MVKERNGDIYLERDLSLGVSMYRLGMADGHG